MRILGIEFGSWSLKAVEVESRFRRLELLDFHEVRLPLKITDKVAAYKPALEQLLAALPSNPDKTVTSLPSTHTIIRQLSIPVKQRKKVEQMYRFELEDSIPFKIEDSIVEHLAAKSKEGFSVIAALATKTQTRSYLDWVKQLGLEPDWLTFEGMGVINIFLSAHDFEDPDKPQVPVCLMDIGHTKTTLAVFEQGRLQLLRTLAWGGQAVNTNIAMTLGASLEEAEMLKMTQLDFTKPQSGEILEASTQALLPLFSELNHSFAAYRNQFKQQVGTIYITGGTAKTKGLDKLLNSRLGVPVHRFHPYQLLDVKDSIKQYDELRFCESWGRAMVFARNAPFLFNFRKADLAKQTSLTVVTSLFGNPNVIRLALYGVILGVMLFLHVTISSYLGKDETRKATNELERVFQDTFRTVPQKQRLTLTRNPHELRKFIEQKNSELDQKLKMLARNRQPMIGLVRTISDAFPKEVRVDVNTLELSEEKFVLEGVLYSGDLNSVTNALQKISTLSEVSLALGDSSVNGQRFSYSGKVVHR